MALSLSRMTENRPHPTSTQLRSLGIVSRQTNLETASHNVSIGCMHCSRCEAIKSLFTIYYCLVTNTYMKNLWELTNSETWVPGLDRFAGHGKMKNGNWRMKG